MRSTASIASGKKRLKQSCVGDLNDPFELLPFDLTNPAVRAAALKTKSDMDPERGLLCFSMDWSDPVIWAHYGDKHKGLCLGFEIPEPNNDDVLKVEYQPKPLQFPLEEYLACSEEEGERITRKALYTKFDNWKYEKEVRVWGPLGEQEKGPRVGPSCEQEDNPLYFVPFNNETLRLVEVIKGIACTKSDTEILNALGPLAEQIVIRKSRRAHDRYEIVEDQDA
jgi:hypothetical protein